MFIHVALLMLALGFGQLGSKPATAPPHIDPTTSSSTLPPDFSPASTVMSNSSVAGSIRTAMSKETRLQHDSVGVTVSDSRVVLDGEVLNHEHRYLAIQIAIDYGGTRTLVDNLRLLGERSLR